MASDVAGTEKNDHAAYARQLLLDKGVASEWEVVLATDFHLQIDVDSPELPAHFEATFAILREHYKVKQHEISASRSGNLHVIIELEQPMKIWERIGWQAILGSDAKREALHYVSVLKRDLNPILLFERKAPNRIAWALPLTETHHEQPTGVSGRDPISSISGDGL